MEADDCFHFVSLQAHEHVFGVGSTYDQETSYIVSAGASPFRSIPWSFTFVQAYTVEPAVRRAIKPAH